MRLLIQEYRRRTVVPLATVGLAAYYLLVYLPLSNKADKLDTPLQKSWRQLAASLGRTNAVSIDFQSISNRLEETRLARSLLASARRRANERLDLPPQLRTRMAESFQLVEYENERGKKLEALTTLAKQQQVTIDPAVYSGFPEHTADVRQPELLWAALSMIDGLLTSALQSKITALHSLETPLVLTNATWNGTPVHLSEIPIQIELTGPVANISRLIQSLPLRGSELGAAGLPVSIPDKPPLYIDRLIIRKQTPEKPEEVRAWLRLVGFVLRE